MSDDVAAARIREAEDQDLPALYELAREALSVDVFSVDLLAEKLFKNPCPEQDRYRVYQAERGDKLVGMMHSVWRPDEGRSWLGVFAVAAAHRRQGIATAMLKQVQSDWQDAGVREAEALAIPGNYFNPGLDPRYTPALCFLEHHGFERFKDCVNLLADLRESFDTAGEQERLRKLGITVRRAVDGDSDLLDAFFAEQFGAAWRLEAKLAMENDPPALHLALKDGDMIAFSAHSSQNREWGFFGPMGTTPAARGTGIGRVLLWHCLNDMRAAGHKTSVIPWVGPIGFYSRYVPCHVERVFWRYRLTLVP